MKQRHAGSAVYGATSGRQRTLVRAAMVLFCLTILSNVSTASAQEGEPLCVSRIVAEDDSAEPPGAEMRTALLEKLKATDAWAPVAPEVWDITLSQFAIQSQCGRLDACAIELARVYGCAVFELSIKPLATGRFQFQSRFERPDEEALIRTVVVEGATPLSAVEGYDAWRKHLRSSNKRLTSSRDDATNLAVPEASASAGNETVYSPPDTLRVVAAQVLVGLAFALPAGLAGAGGFAVIGDTDNLAALMLTTGGSAYIGYMTGVYAGGHWWGGQGDAGATFGVGSLAAAGLLSAGVIAQEGTPLGVVLLLAIVALPTAPVLGYQLSAPPPPPTTPVAPLSRSERPAWAPSAPTATVFPVFSVGFP